MPRPLVACVATFTLLFAGCAGDRPWPVRPVALATPAFATQGEIATIDVLPLDLAIWAEPGYQGNLADVRASTEAGIMNVAIEALAERNYALGAIIDWDGNTQGGAALTQDDLLHTVNALSRYGAATIAHPGRLPVPFLPARLGTATGADATLYVGGWGYVARPRESTGKKVGEAIVVALLILTVVAIIAIAVEKSSSHGHGSSHGGGHSGGGTAGRGGASGGRGGSSVGGHAGRGFTAGRGVEHVHPGRGTSAMLDAFGRTAIDIAIESIDWSEDPALPHEGGESQMYLEMTLVDNRTGLALWHAHQLFPAGADDAPDVARAARTMLQVLPPRANQPPGAQPPGAQP